MGIPTLSIRWCPDTIWGFPSDSTALPGLRSSIVLNRGSTISGKVKTISGGDVATSLPAGGMARSSNAWAEAGDADKKHHQCETTDRHLRYFTGTIACSYGVLAHIMYGLVGSGSAASV